MRLIGSRTSPYVRKVRVVADELDLTRHIALEMLDPHAAPPELDAVNPVRKVPVLVTEDGMVLQDSPVIAEWMCAEFGGERLLPASGSERWRILSLQALADGFLDAGVLIRMENQRPEDERSPAWIDKQAGKVFRSLDWLERDATWRRAALDLGQIAVAIAVGWLLFRLPDMAGLDRRPGLRAWYEDIAARSSMELTAPAS